MSKDKFWYFYTLSFVSNKKIEAIMSKLGIVFKTRTEGDKTFVHLEDEEYEKIVNKYLEQESALERTVREFAEEKGYEFRNTYSFGPLYDLHLAVMATEKPEILRAEFEAYLREEKKRRKLLSNIKEVYFVDSRDN